MFYERGAVSQSQLAEALGLAETVMVSKGIRAITIREADGVQWFELTSAGRQAVEDLQNWLSRYYPQKGQPITQSGSET